MASCRVLPRSPRGWEPCVSLIFTFSWHLYFHCSFRDVSKNNSLRSRGLCQGPPRDSLPAPQGHRNLSRIFPVSHGHTLRGRAVEVTEGVASAPQIPQGTARLRGKAGAKHLAHVQKWRAAERRIRSLSAVSKVPFVQ